MKRSMTETMIAQPACLPSDSEEEEDDDDGSDSDSDEKDNSEPFQGKKKKQKIRFFLVERNILVHTEIYFIIF